MVPVAGEGAVELMLLRQQSVQKELKLSKDEVDKIHTFGEQQWEKAQSVHVLPQAEQTKKYAEMSKENETFVKETLTKDQQKRLHQITLQMAGLLCLSRPAVASALKLTEDQKAEVVKLQKKAHQEAEELIHVTKKNQKLEKLRELHETSLKSIEGLLTDEQEAKWTEMIGPVFKADLAFFHPE